jgi:LysM domain
VKIRAAAGLIVLSASVALAQDVSDLQPPAPQPPKGSAGTYYPGMPLPPSPDARGGNGGGGGRSVGETGDDNKKAPSGLILFDNDYSVEEPQIIGPGPTAINTPDTVVVKKGDTLWGLSSTYLKDAWAWPKLWSYNPSITNPHWIYPGDIIHLGPPGQVLPPEPPVATGPAKTPDEPRKIGTTALPQTISLHQLGFVESKELDDAGKIVGSKEERIMLATLDEAYVEYKQQKPLTIGGRYTIYKPIRTVKHPVTGERLGEIVQIFGECDVRQTTESRIARVQIIDSNDGIERGYLVGPLRREFRMPEHKVAKADLAGVVVTQLRDQELIGAQMIVFLDRGFKDGVEVGHHFFVVRRGDGYQPLLWRGGPIDDKRFPREDVGEVVVLETRERLATALVLRSTKEVRVGDRVELRNGK